MPESGAIDYLIEYPSEWILPLAGWIETATDFIIDAGEPLWDTLAVILRFALAEAQAILSLAPWSMMLLVFSALGFFAGGLKLGIGVGLGFLLIASLGMWDLAMSTLALVLVAAALSIILGIPLGILMSKYEPVNRALRPVLDLMQTLPSFVYLIPVVMIFSIGQIPALLATFIYSVPPTIRLTNLGIRQVASDVVEAGKSLGSTSLQLLIKIQLPLALPTIMAGINQTIMMALAMVVIASMIGAGGLGVEVLRGVGQLDIGRGFVGGICIVVLAIVIDRLTQEAIAPPE
ncbi:MAG: proline/glycine betaine ABC transporter permease [Bacillota bacterium]